EEAWLSKIVQTTKYKTKEHVGECPELYKIGMNFGDENCDFKDHVAQHEEGLVFA
ncbi:13311_t:CDS:2, partial [Dentiscutata heterogama]